MPGYGGHLGGQPEPPAHQTQHPKRRRRAWPAQAPTSRQLHAELFVTISGCGALGSTIGEEEQGLICAGPQLPKSGLSSGPLATSKPTSGNTGPSSPIPQTVWPVLRYQSLGQGHQVQGQCSYSGDPMS